MTRENPVRTGIDRRTTLCTAAGVLGATLLAGTARPAFGQGPGIEAEEHWVKKRDIKLFVYRKRTAEAVATKRPVLFLVHGSTFSGRGGFDLQVPGGARYSLMDEFARRGFDVWTMDHEGYGRSDRTGGQSRIADGVEDLHHAIGMVEQVTGQRSVMMYGQSAGALRAGAFAAAEPHRVSRLVLDAFTYTGVGAPEIDRRRKAADSYRANPSRKLSRQSFQRIFTRDDPGTSDPAVAEALADFELALGDTVPSGTYLDMATILPVVDPKAVQCPVCLVRAEHDGNSTEAELLQFFSMLPNMDKQFHFLAGLAHVATLGVNRHRLWHVMHAFLTYPDRITA